MLILVRHGRTDANARSLLQGRLDLPLDEIGQRQAEVIGRVLAGIDDVVSSSLTRATMTASAIAQPVIDDRWIELDYGSLDGVPISEVPDEVWHRWRTDPDFVAGGGESMRQLNMRVRAACEDLAATAAMRDVVVVSHVSPIKAAVAWALGQPVEEVGRMFLDQASVCRIGIGRFGPFLHTFNDTSHLSLL
ncbi:MAG: histidine phosphatase family protein [Acidimicrobiia bacterium]